MSATKKNKKAQIRITETVAVLFIFFILMGLGIVFYAKYHQIALLEERSELLQRRAIEITLKSLYLPELLCSRGEAVPEGGCIDLLKARHFVEIVQQQPSYYFDLFSYSKISLHQLYPLSPCYGSADLCQESGLILYDQPRTNEEGSMEITSSTNIEKTFFVVALRDETKGHNNPAYAYGYLEVGVYS